MKYFTKEWHLLPTDRTLCMKPCKDRAYSEEEIAELYQRKLSEAIEEERSSYDEPPFFLPVDFDGASVEDFLILDEETGEAHHPATVEEAKKRLEEERRRAQEEYERRPPFDERETVAFFREAYERKKESCPYEMQPELFALDYLPNSLFKRFKREDRANERKRKRAERAFRRDKARTELFDVSLHDGAFLSFTDGTLAYRDEEGEHTLLFADCTVLENEAQKGDWFLYEEVYKRDFGYEICFLLEGSEPHYLTFTAKNLKK